MGQLGSTITFRTAGSPGQFGGFLVSELPGYQSRSQGKLASGSGDCPDGILLGQIIHGARTVTAAAKAGGNTGTGTLTPDATTPVAEGAPDGVYRVVVTAAATNAGTIEVFAPDGSSLGEAGVGTTFDNQVKFATADGATDFAVGDEFTITVATAAGSLKYVPWAADGDNGAEIVAGILLGRYDATASDQLVAVVDKDAEVQRAMLVFDGTPTTDEKNAAYAQLAKLGIKLR